MKNKFLKVTGIVVVCIALVVFWGYNKYFTPDPEVRQQLNSQFGEDFFKFEDEKIVGNSETVNNESSMDGLDKQRDISIIESMPDKEKEQGEGINAASVNDTNVAKKITQDDITNKYKPKFNYLQNVALNRLDTLYSAAIQDYVQSGKAGTLNRSEIVRKYIQAGTMLEGSVDDQFYKILDAMRAELIANNLATDIVGASKMEYEKAKSSRRSQLLAKVLK